MRCLTATLLLLTLSPAVAAASPEIPGAPQSAPIALVGGTVHPVSGPEIPDGIVLFNEGRIVAVGTEVELSEDVLRIDVSGKHVYPGMIDPYTNLGLVEIPSVRGSRDESETGAINPNTRALIAINPDSELIPVARSAGVLTVLSAPTGGLLSGTSALVNLDGWTYEDMAVVPSVGMHLTWPRMTPVSAWWMTDTAKRQLEARDRALKQIREAFDDARAYWKAKRASQESGAPRPDFDARWEAMLPVLDGELPLIVAADEIQQIQGAVAFAEREGLKLILLGGYDAPHCAELLRKHNIPVIVGGIHRLPQRRTAFYDEPFTLPERLRQAGIRFCISSNERTAKIMNLPNDVGTAVAHGLPHLEALRAVTLYPAEIFGAADRLGTLEPDKDATLIVADGDILESDTHVERAYIQGREVDLNNRHKRLWAKYKEKYRRQGIEQ